MADNRMNIDAHPRPELLISSSLRESKCFRTADTTLIARLCWASSALASPREPARAARHDSGGHRGPVSANEPPTERFKPASADF